MNQTKLDSFIEAWVNIIIGFAINWVANLLVLPHFGFNITMRQAFWVGVIFTAISLARSYLLRRAFNGRNVGHVVHTSVKKYFTQR